MTPVPDIQPDNLAAALDYHNQHRGLRLVVRQNNEVLCDHCAPHLSPDSPLPIASGTKSLAGILAAVAASDGFLHLDEPVADTLSEWATHPRKSRISARNLLQLTSGLPAGGKAGYTPEFESALHIEPVADPGERFLYGATPFQAFGEFARRKLSTVCSDPLDFLYTRVFDSINLRPGRWRRTSDGWPDLSAGLSLPAVEWAKLGEWIRQKGSWENRAIIPPVHLDECFHGSAENPAYGLGWWLNTRLQASSKLHLKQATLGLEDLNSEPSVPVDLVYAAGAGKQRLYVSRTARLVIARQADGILEALAGGERSPFSDCEFFRLLFPQRATPQR